VRPTADLSPALEWEEPSGGPVVHPLDDALASFIRIAAVPDHDLPERVLQFARRFGVLRVCGHGKPLYHDRSACKQRLAPSGDGRQWEPVEAWRRYSRQLLAILRATAHLQNQESVPGAVWQDIAAGDPAAWRYAAVQQSAQFNSAHGNAGSRPDFAHVSGAADSGLGLDHQRRVLTDCVNRWLEYGRVRPTARWLLGMPTASVHLDFDGLAGLLAVQLASAVSSRIYVCAGCGLPFSVPEERRLPARDKRAWCPLCGRLAQWKRYSQQYYKAKKEVKKRAEEPREQN
jgi:hypothetical protein